jgi:LmbE family N-acetylglucosaminyl deacetylase
MPQLLGLLDTPAPVVLCIGAHSDDIEIGCGATLLSLLRHRPETAVHWVVLSARGERAEEATAGAQAFAGANVVDLRLGEFRDAYFPYQGREVKELFDVLGREISPDVVFTHQRDDLHQDHRLVAELARNTFRRHLVLEFEIPKYDGDMGRPNLFVPVDEELAHRKTELIHQVFASQRDKSWLTDDVFLGLMRLRGMESGTPNRYAEAFYAYKLNLAFT